MWAWIVGSLATLVAYLVVFESPLWQHYDQEPEQDNTPAVEIP